MDYASLTVLHFLSLVAQLLEFEVHIRSEIMRLLLLLSRAKITLESLFLDL